MDDQKERRTASEAIMDFLDWTYEEKLSDYEKGIRMGLKIAQQSGV